jgi:hypothetical protein
MKFIIVAPGYDDNGGGIVVLHQLCDKLNQLGYEAYLWPFFKPALDFTNPIKAIYLFFRYFRKNIKYGFKKNPKLNTPTASYQDLEDAVIVYPEVIVGNPLKAQNVVRWLLHKPGFNNGGKIDFGVNDLFFYYSKAFDDSRYNSHPDNKLHIISQRSDVYNITNHDMRHGTCYLLRKGYKREVVHDITDSRLIDGLSHRDTAQVFNQVKYCISYDTYTMYNVYAAMCGCIPIVIPEKGITKEQWQPNEENGYGIAYGFDDIDYAVKTRPLLLKHIKKQEEESNDSVMLFVEKCKTYFIF